MLAGIIKILLTSKSPDKFFCERAMRVATRAFLKAERASCYPGRPFMTQFQRLKPSSGGQVQPPRNLRV